MKEISEYLAQDKAKRNFKKGVELLSKHESTYAVAFGQQIKKEKPDVLMVHLLENRLRRILRIKGNLVPKANPVEISKPLVQTEEVPEKKITKQKPKPLVQTEEIPETEEQKEEKVEEPEQTDKKKENKKTEQ